MLELAYRNKEELQKKFLEIAFVDKYKYYNCGSDIGYKLELSDSSWNSLEFISKKDGIILGYLGAKINRDSGYVSSLCIVNFYDKNIEFSRDFRQFLIDLLFKYSFYKINFSVCVGNPAEKMYDRFIKKYGGRIVGYYEKDTKLWTGEYCDVKHYEIMKKTLVSKEEINEKTEDIHRN